MPRRAFDAIASSVGIVLTAVLLVAGALLFWGYGFANDNVTSQLEAQRIFFPAADNAQLERPEIGPYLKQYAGKQLVTGEQARVYADHYIAVHLNDAADGRTYAETSTLSRQNPDNAELAEQVQTLFRGETLRGLLLNAYAFWKIGQLALIGSIVAFALGGVMAVLTILGFWHLRRVPADEEILTPPVEVRQTA